MRWFLNLRTGGKLLVSYGLLITLIAVFMILTYFGIRSMQASQTLLHDERFPSVILLTELRADLNRSRAIIFEMMLTRDPGTLRALESVIREGQDEIDEGLEGITRLHMDEPEFMSRLAALRSVLEEYRQAREDITSMLRQGRVEEAQQLVLGSQDNRFERIRAMAIELSNDEQAAAERQVEQSNRIAERLMLELIVMIAMSAVIAVGAVAAMNRTIARPLDTLTGVAERISAGDLSMQVDALSREDEVGALSQSFHRMRNALRDVVSKIQEGFNVLASSSSEIVSATAQVASGTTETATAVSETTSTVEEVKHAAHVSAQKAKQVSEVAQRTAETSTAGRDAVDATIEGMNRIRNQMESIAESVVRLSEQGQAIGDIITTVNDLAEQSNLLAVNAAIEAARAGEQGKGFGVVAQEVRRLAEQSKQATAQVRTILGDIQKSTGAAVMATEQGSKAVEAGVNQANDAGAAIRELAESLAEAAKAAAQIAASSQQQLAGMDQVALAMENISQASSQNVAGTRQSEEAAQNIRRLGQELQELVSQFKT